MFYEYLTFTLISKFCILLNGRGDSKNFLIESHDRIWAVQYTTVYSEQPIS